MTAKCKFFHFSPAAGNVMIYVLIMAALLTALTMILAHQHGDRAAGSISDNAANINATQILQVSGQVKQAVNRMIYSGAHPVSPPAQWFIKFSALKAGGAPMPQIPA